ERIGGKIRKPHQVAPRCVTNGQRATVLVFVERAFGPAPPAAIFRHAGPVIDPSVRVGRSVEITDLELDLPSSGACDPKVKPLIKIGSVIFRDSQDRKSTRLNSSHVKISYAVFCLKKKKKNNKHK